MANENFESKKPNVNVKLQCGNPCGVRVSLRIMIVYISGTCDSLNK